MRLAAPKPPYFDLPNLAEKRAMLHRSQSADRRRFPQGEEGTEDAGNEKYVYAIAL